MNTICASFWRFSVMSSKVMTAPPLAIGWLANWTTRLGDISCSNCTGHPADSIAVILPVMTATLEPGCRPCPMAISATSRGLRPVVMQPWGRPTIS